MFIRFVMFTWKALFTIPLELRYSLFLSIILCIYPFISQAQEISQESERGLSFIQNINPKEYKAHAQNWSVTQDNRGIVYIGNGNGLLEYDGSTWRVIPMPNKSVVRSVDIDREGKIYVGAHAELGYLSPDSIGVMHFYSLLDHIGIENRNFNNVWNVHTTPQGTYFRTSSHLFLWSDKHMEVWKLKDAFHKSYYELISEGIIPQSFADPRHTFAIGLEYGLLKPDPNKWNPKFAIGLGTLNSLSGEPDTDNELLFNFGLIIDSPYK